MTELTPMLKQYYAVKEQHRDAILMFRLGDFYEMFGEDAKVASRELDIVLTARNKGSDLKMPMCGVPFHAVESYIAKLVKAGHKVALCDQMEDPAQAKGIVRREVTRIITPGTLDSTNGQRTTANTFVLSIAQQKGALGLAWADVQTGEITVRELSTEHGLDAFRSELARIDPAEIILPESAVQKETPSNLYVMLSSEGGRPVFAFADWAYVQDNALEELLRQFAVRTLDGFGIAADAAVIPAAGALIAYLRETQKRAVQHMTRLQVERDGDHMFLDAQTIRALELIDTIHTSEQQHSLYGIMREQVSTSMGMRLLKRWLLQPLLDVAAINQRLDAVEFFYKQSRLHATVPDLLDQLADLQRLAARISLRRLTPPECIKLKESLQLLPLLKEKLVQALAEASGTSERIDGLVKELQELPDLITLVSTMIVDEPPAVLARGGVIRPDNNAELAELVEIRRSGKDWIRNLETAERTRTGINSLKVKYNKVFGYYIEVTNANLNAVPDDYIRKQTLVNAERYITPDLKEYEAKVLGAEERMVQLEQALYEELLEKLAAYIPALQQSAERVAELDVLFGFALLARKNIYQRPLVDSSDCIEIREGRHPVVERLMQGERFIPNDAYLSSTGEQIVVLTGPNMAGKSTWLRQVALITLMAQIGSFVPAKHARIGGVDRIFTRIGAADAITRGQSTFMVEMQETANILNNATARSLIILDEIGRGTSTFDGLSIAWAVVEYLHNGWDDLNHEGNKGEEKKSENNHGPKTLFATHYHELIQLADELPRVKNFNIAVKEIDGKVVFLRRIVPGGVDESYGIHVAQLAGLPREVLARAERVLEQIESTSGGLDERLRRTRQSLHQQQMAFVAVSVSSSPDASEDKEHAAVHREQKNPALEALKEVKIETLTPLEALNKLAELKKQAN
ncbi:MAG TPA: DNA mismatch repair protein MutS [bacterium]|nr:DNA mismatch repair protein MutS [bacterium]